MSRPSILELRQIGVRYGVVHALDQVDLRVGPGERIGVVGASGSGKSTLLAVAGGLCRPTDGTIAREPDARIGLILQDPVSSLNPGWTIEQLVGEPLLDLRPRLPAPDRRRRIGEALALARLTAVDPTRRPSELSVGQCQRVALARALAAGPSLLLADEPTSALDASVAASVLRALDVALTATGAALLLVSHDLLATAPIVRRVVVLDEGRLVEDGPTDRILAQPRHQATRHLVDAARALVIGAQDDGPTIG